MPSVFDSQDVFDRFPVVLQFRTKILGGTPQSGAGTIEKWLAKKTGVTDEVELQAMVIRTLEELGHEIPEDATYAALMEQFKTIAGKTHTNGFKRDDQGLYVESRQVKAMVKESTNTLFAGQRWGETRKGPKSYVAERIFVAPEHEHIPLGVEEPSELLLHVGHVSGPQGKRSTLTYFEAVDRPRISFDLIVARPKDGETFPTLDEWAKLWVHMQENGLGAMRSQGYGRFDVEQFGELVA